MSRAASWLLAALALAGAAAVRAQSAVPPPGAPPAAALCHACHGVDGMAMAPDAPNLAGQQRYYTVQQLRAFRSGARRHEVMNVIAKGLSDADIDALGEWYASFKVQVSRP